MSETKKGRKTTKKEKEEEKKEEKNEEVSLRRSTRTKKPTERVGTEEKEEKVEKKGRKGKEKKAEKEKKEEKEEEKKEEEKEKKEEKKEEKEETVEKETEKEEKKDKGKRKSDEEDVDEAAQALKKTKLSHLSTFFTETTQPLHLQEILTVKEVAKLTVHEFEPHFDRIAGHLLNDCVFFVGGVPHRLTEIEFYFNGYNHQDHFAHGNPLQKTRGQWYFHMSGKSFRGGSFKGLDLSFGDSNAFGGILLRGLEALNSDNYVDGPSLLVDHVLKLTDHAKIDDLVKKFDGPPSAENGSGSEKHPLYLVAGEGISIEKRQVVKSARVGLTLKNFEDGKEKFIGKNYRYMSNPKKTVKGRHYSVVGLTQKGLQPAEITATTKATAASVKKCIELFEKGKSLDYKKFIDKTLSNDDVCELIGACHQFAYPSHV